MLHYVYVMFSIIVITVYMCKSVFAKVLYNRILSSSTYAMLQRIMPGRPDAP